MIRLHLVWIAGLRLGFHPIILRLCLEAFSFARVLVLGGACADPVVTLTAILAGGSFATDAIYMVLVEPCDTMIQENPRADMDLCLFVDDIALHVVGDTASAVANQMHSLSNRCILLLGGELQAKVSRGKTWKLDGKAKTVGLGSSVKVLKKLKPKLKALGIDTRRKGKLLGVDYSSGRKLQRPMQQARLKAAASRRRMISRFGRRAARRVIATGLGPAIRYGAGVVGASDAAVAKARRISCTAEASMAGRS